LNKVTAWAKANKCTTNYKTGLHINVDVPNYNQDQLDYVKLALLLGDEHVLEQFGRASNTYAKSAIGKVRDRVKARPYEAKYLLDKMKGHMGELASHAIHSSSTDKFTSINPKTKHVEFRSPGGDWLDENLDKIENTLLRFTVALSAAMDPKAYREEYLKKLYKVLNPQNLQDTYGEMIQEFANYMAALQKGGADTGGALSKETQQAVKSFRQAAAQELKQKNIDKKLKKSGEAIVNGHRWRVELKPELGGGVVEVIAADPIDAKKQAKIEQPNWRFVDDSALTITRLDEPAAGASTTAPHPQGRGRPNDPNGRLAIVNKDDPRNYGDRVGSEAPDYLFRFTLADGYSQAQLRAVKAAWAARENKNADDYIIVDTMQFAAPAASESGSVQWNIINRNNETVHTFWNRNVQADANTAAHEWLTNHRFSYSVDGQGPFDVVPAAIPGSTQDLQRQRQAADVAANTRRWADYEASQAPTPVAGVQDIEPDVEQYTSQPAQTQWEVYDRSTNQPVFRMYAENQAAAWRKGQEWVANYARMTPDQPIDPADYSVRQSAQPVTEATGDKRFDAMMGQIQREPAIPDPQMPPTDVKDLYAWAVKNNKPYHKIFAEWANREGYKSVAPALLKAGNLDSDALDYWTPDVWKLWFGPDSEMPQGWSKERVPDELRDYLETVFDAYENIWQDWPTEYRQIGQQGVAEGQETYLSPNMKAVPNQDPNSSEDHDYYYKDQQIKPGDPFHSQIKDLHLRQLDPTYDAFRNAFDNPLTPGPAVPQQLPQGDTIIPSRPVPPEKIKGPDGKPLKLKDIMQQDPPLSEGNGPGKSVVDAILKVMPATQEIWFHGSRATGKHRRNSDTDILVVVPDDLVGDQYLGVVRILQKLSSHFDNYDIQPTKAGTNIHRIAQEEGQLLWSNKQDMAEDESNDTAISLSKLGKFHPGADTLAKFVPERATAQYALHPDKWESTFYSLTNKDSDKLKYYGPKKISIPPGTLVGDMAIANKFYRAKTPEEQEQYAEMYKASLQPYPVDVSHYRMPELLIPKQDMAEGLEDNGISFKVQKGKNKFATTLSVGSNPVGVYQYDATTGRSIAEVYPEFKGKGLGKLLVLHAIYTAAKLGLDFQEDESRTSEYDNVLDSLSSNGYIIDDDGYWYVTGEGEQYLQQSIKQGVEENFADGRNPQDKGDAKRHGINTKASVSSLRKTAKQGGRKGQLAHWLANMKAGRAKKKTNETVIGNLHFPQLTIAVDDHSIDRTRTRGIDPHTIDLSLRKLNAVADQLAQIEPNAQVWAYDAANNLGLGLRRISSRDMLFKLKTVVADRPFDGAIPIIELS
jgi:predicted nucleotidyltransferase/GNAT superfamily N-acetyltransferase